MMKKNIKTIKLNNAGSTMIEVLVGFVLLMILMASIVGIIDLSSDLRMKAKDILDEQSAFQSELYKKNYGVADETGHTGTNTMSIVDIGDFSLVETDSEGRDLTTEKATIKLNSGLTLKRIESTITGQSVYIFGR